jgi:hypothetical protein
MNRGVGRVALLFLFGGFSYACGFIPFLCFFFRLFFFLPSVSSYFNPPKGSLISLAHMHETSIYDQSVLNDHLVIAKSVERNG